MLASNGIKKYRDLSFIDDDVINDLTLTPVSIAKVRKRVKALGAPAPVPEETLELVQETGDERELRDADESCVYGNLALGSSSSLGSAQVDGRVRPSDPPPVPVSRPGRKSPVPDAFITAFFA